MQAVFASLDLAEMQLFLKKVLLAVQTFPPPATSNRLFTPNAIFPLTVVYLCTVLIDLLILN